MDGGNAFYMVAVAFRIRFNICFTFHGSRRVLRLSLRIALMTLR